jgi:hypothetical protein
MSEGIKKKLRELSLIMESQVSEQFQLEPEDLPTKGQIKKEKSNNNDDSDDRYDGIKKIDKDKIIPDAFPINGIEQIIYSVIQMSLTESLNGLSEELQDRYLELDGLLMDIQLRLLGTLANPELIAKAAKKVTALIEYGRKREEEVTPKS